MKKHLKMAVNWEEAYNLDKYVIIVLWVIFFAKFSLEEGRRLRLKNKNFFGPEYRQLPFAEPLKKLLSNVQGPIWDHLIVSVSQL